MLSFCVSLAYADLMRRRLPNLNAVKAFDAAARHQSFTRAAEELSVTHAAISRQVRALEQELGTALFERRHRQVALTVDGRRYAEIVADALLLLGLGPNDQVAQHAAERVVLEVDSDLATLWPGVERGRDSRTVVHEAADVPTAYPFVRATATLSP